MNDNRKFRLCVCFTLSFIILFLFRILSESGFITLISLTFGTFVLGNVADKFAPKAGQ